MTLVNNNKLSREDLQALFLQYAGPGTAPDSSPDQVGEYDFYKPHYFNKKQIALLNTYFETLGSLLATGFSNICNCPFNVKITSMTEIFSENLISTSQDEKMPYNLAIQNSTSGCELGFLSIPQESAQSWTTQLLGESEPAESPQLSEIELSLLIETATSFIKALSDSHPSLNCQSVSETLSRSIPIQLDDCVEMSKIVFELSDEKGENNSQATFVIVSSCLDSIAGKQGLSDNQNIEQDHKQQVIECLKNQQVSLAADFAKIKLTIEDVMNLQTDDVILLDKKVGQPIDLSIDGIKIFQAQLVQCEDSYGVAIIKTFKNNIN